MKKIFLLVTLVFTLVSGQAANPGFTTATTSPEASLVNDRVTYNVEFTTGTGAMDFIAGNPAIITASPLKSRFTNPEQTAILGVTGSLAQYFTWSIDPEDPRVIIGVQNQLIPSSMHYTLDVAAVVTEATSQENYNNNPASGNGALFNLNPGATPDASQADNSVSAYGFTTGFLSASFGNIKAALNNNLLSVSWATVSEENNQYFVIQASGDGKVFHAVDSVTSKAAQGNSSSVLNYVYQKDLNQLVSLLGVVSSEVFVGVVILSLIAFLLKRNTTKQWYALPLLAILIFVGFSCKKDKEETIDTGKDKDLYIRISQVDIDGGRSYSNVIKVTRE